MWTLLITAALAGTPDHLVVHVEGMTCGGCEQRIGQLLGELPEVQAVRASFAHGAACVIGHATAEVVRSRLEGAGYTVGVIEASDACPPGLDGKGKPSAWSNSHGLDVKIISTGDTFALKAQRVEGRFTVVDFGASWCGPCHALAKRLTAYMQEHDDISVRAVELEGDSPTESFALPVAKQHLAFAPGLPWVIAYGPTGKRIYQGGEVEELITAIEAARR